MEIIIFLIVLCIIALTGMGSYALYLLLGLKGIFLTLPILIAYLLLRFIIKAYSNEYLS